MIANGKTPEDIEALLPWHAAGTLSRRDAERVETALAADQELARRFALVREELAETIRLNEMLGAPSARAGEKLFAALDAQPPRRSKIAIGARISEFLAGLGPRTLAWSAAVAALAIVLQAGALTSLILLYQRSDLDQASYRSVNYRTASAPASSQAGVHVLIRFAPDASAADITKLLDGYKASVVDGPKPGGLYRLRLPVGKDELARVVGEMQGNRLVGFVAAE